VLSQTYQNVEIIVVDDGSTDDTRDFASFPDRRVRYAWQENSGVSTARNLGMRLAKGEFIAFLDSDDAWLPCKIDLQLSVLRSLPSAVMIWTDMIAVDDADAEIAPSYLTQMYRSGYRHFDRRGQSRTSGPIALRRWSAANTIPATSSPGCFSVTLFTLQR
jgi:glycosyltransferase involved in cell wall biosynthesis